MTPYLLVLGIALVASAVFTRGAITLAPRLRFLDRPGSEAHKQQARVVPYGGGPAMAVAMAVALGSVWWFIDWPTDQIVNHGPLWPVIIGAAVLLALGASDDRKAWRAKPKLAVQAAVAAFTVWQSDLAIDSFQQLPWLAYGLAWAWLVVVTNAYNLIDHADGLAASVGLISAGVLLTGALFAGDQQLVVVYLALMGALAGYLLWNRPPARIYMGDAGSLPLGYLIGVGTLAITFWPSNVSGSWLAVFTPLIITAIPMFDAAAVVIKRLRRGKPIMQGDRNHVGHRLVRLGLSPVASLGVVTLLQLSLAGSALQLRTGDLTAGIMVLVQVVATLLALVLLETSRDHGPT